MKRGKDEREAVCCGKVEIKGQGLKKKTKERGKNCYMTNIFPCYKWDASNYQNLVWEVQMLFPSNSSLSDYHLFFFPCNLSCLVNSSNKIMISFFYNGIYNFAERWRIRLNDDAMNLHLLRESSVLSSYYQFTVTKKQHGTDIKDKFLVRFVPFWSVGSLANRTVCSYCLSYKQRHGLWKM